MKERIVKQFLYGKNSLIVYKNLNLFYLFFLHDLICKEQEDHKNQ